MKHLRQYIRQILKEIAYNRRDAFLADLYGQDFDHNFIERGEDDEAYRRMAGAGRKSMRPRQGILAHIAGRFLPRKM